MSFNSKQYLAYEEGRLEPDSTVVRGSYRRYPPKRFPEGQPREEPKLSENEDNKKQEAYIEEQIAKHLNKTP